MPKRSNEFQRIILAIHHQLAGHASVQESRMLPDRWTGEKREVDIVIEAPVGEYVVLLCIECCDSARRATVEWVERMLGKHSTLPTDKLILVSRAGFTKNAITKAQHGGAEPLSLGEAEQVEWTKLVHRVRRLIFETAIARTMVVPGLDADPTDTASSLPHGQLVYSRDDKWVVTVDQIEGAILSNPTLRSHTLNTLKENAKGGWVIGIELANGTYTIDSKGERQELEAISVVVLIDRRRLSIDLRTALFRGFHVAYGEAADEIGSAVMVVLEREGRPPQGVVVHDYYGIQDVAYLPGNESPLLNAAPDDAMKALIRSASAS